jgi:hypothetical protein
MFIIDSQYNVKTSLPVITDNYTIIHFDEFPILFSGTNKYGNKLLGSLSYEDDDLFRYFVIILDDKQYSDFINKRKSYLDLIKLNQEVFIVDKDINNVELSIYQLPIIEIPEEYLPHPNSFIPEQKTSRSLNFGFGLKGKLADLHKAIVSDVNTVNQKIYDYLQESLETLGYLSLSPFIYSQPSITGSYRLNFDIEFKQSKQLDIFQINQDKIGEFVNGYLNYIAYSLPVESDDFLNTSPEESKGFQTLKENLIEIYNSVNIQPASTITDKLIENINNSANKLSEVTEYLKTSQSFNSIELGNYNENGDFATIGYLDKEYKASVTSKLLIEESLLLGDNEVLSDETPQSYRVLVYQLNRFTGKGCARLYYHDEDYYNVRLHIERGDQELTNSVFTKSLDEDKVVDVNGIAIKVNGIYKRLDCYL